MAIVSSSYANSAPLATAVATVNNADALVGVLTFAGVAYNNSNFSMRLFCSFLTSLLVSGTLSNGDTFVAHDTNRLSYS